MKHVWRRSEDEYGEVQYKHSAGRFRIDKHVVDDREYDGGYVVTSYYLYLDDELVDLPHSRLAEAKSQASSLMQAKGHALEGHTPAAARAVRLLVEHPGIPARAFGHLMWPGHWAHEQWAGKRKAGVAQGRAMWLKAGSYLNDLERRGLVWGYRRGGHGALWHATEAGERLARETSEEATSEGGSG